MTEVNASAGLREGLIVARNYRVVKALAQGGFGTVYLGENTTLAQRVVIKVLRGAERGAGAEEARMLAALDHPNVVHVYAHDATHDCIVMQHLSGDSLFAQQDKLDLVSAIRVAYQVALALKAVHAAGLVHRDVKPENVMLGRDHEWVKLIDMGTALRVGRVIANPAGTPEFCGPEQFDPKQPASPANDIYALGATLFLLCTRQLPYDGPANELANAHTFEPVPNLAERFMQQREGLAAMTGSPLEPLDARLDFILEKVSELVGEMMAKEPQHRPDARAVASRLGELESRFSGESTQVGYRLPPVPIQLTQQAAASKPSTMVLPRLVPANTNEVLAEVRRPSAMRRVLGGAAVLSLLMLAGWAFWPQPPQPPQQPQPVVVPPVDVLPTVAVPSVAIDAGQPELELVPLPARPEPEKSPRTPVRVAVKVESPRCVVDDDWRRTARANLEELSQLAATRDDLMLWAAGENEVISRAIAIASASTDCAAVEQRIERLNVRLNDKRNDK